MIHNRIRIARTSEDKDLLDIQDTLSKGQPFYDTKTNRLFISEEDNKRINTLVDSDAITSYKIAVPRKLRTKLDSVIDATFDGSSDQEQIPITGVLPISNGGTGVSDSTTESNITVKNVKSTINGKSISNIFESDGVTVKKATNADIAADVPALNITDIWTKGDEIIELDCSNRDNLIKKTFSLTQDDINKYNNDQLHFKLIIEFKVYPKSTSGGITYTPSSMQMLEFNSLVERTRVVDASTFYQENAITFTTRQIGLYLNNSNQLELDMRFPLARCSNAWGTNLASDKAIISVRKIQKVGVLKN